MKQEGTWEIDMVKNILMIMFFIAFMVLISIDEQK